MIISSLVWTLQVLLLMLLNKSFHRTLCFLELTVLSSVCENEKKFFYFIKSEKYPQCHSLSFSLGWLLCQG